VAPRSVAKRNIQKRYDASEKGRLRTLRYNRSAKGQARYLKHEASAKRKASRQRYETACKGRAKRRIYIGDRYLGNAETVESAERINAHIKERMSAFQRQQAREKAESLSQS